MMIRHVLVLIILVMVLINSGCSSDENIPMEQIYGTYEHIYSRNHNEWGGIRNTITLYSDSTYEHFLYNKDGLIVHEKGIYKYGLYNELFVYNYTLLVKYLSDTPTKNKVNRFHVKKDLFNRVYLTVDFICDPDGSPSLPKYKKKN